MAGKGAMHIATTKTFTSSEGRENERRWNEQMLIYKNGKEENNYDPTRMHLNFEIDSEGKVRKLGFNKEELHERLQQRLAELGHKDFIATAKNAPNIAARFIFSGDHDTLMKMAFGEQKVNTSKGETNSQLVRMDAIEQWAASLHRWLCDMYGKENVIGLQVHLDERTPHAHALIIPVGTVCKHRTSRHGVREFFEKDKVMWSAKFGKNRTEWSDIMKELHTSLYNNVNKPYNMERGDSVEGRNVHHVDKVDFFRRLPALLDQFEKALWDLACVSNEVEETSVKLSGLKRKSMELEKECKQKQTKVKGLTTMVQNKENALADIDEELKHLQEELGSCSADPKVILTRISTLKGQKSKLEEELKDKQEKLLAAKKELDKKISEIEGEEKKIKKQIEKLKVSISQNAFTLEERARYSILREVMRIGTEEFSTQLRNNHYAITSMFHDTLLMDMAEQSNEIMTCAMLLYLEMIDQATQVAQSHGGGGGGASARGWRRSPDENDRQWARRCLNMAGRMMKPAARRIKR